MIGGWKPEYPEENHPSQSLKVDNQCLKKKRSKLEDMININKFVLDSDIIISPKHSGLKSEKSTNLRSCTLMDIINHMPKSTFFANFSN